jgi:hypothetical protein
MLLTISAMQSSLLSLLVAGSVLLGACAAASPAHARARVRAHAARRDVPRIVPSGARSAPSTGSRADD